MRKGKKTKKTHEVDPWGKVHPSSMELTKKQGQNNIQSTRKVDPWRKIHTSSVQLKKNKAEVTYREHEK